ncbi:GNAT family N-acetyltransferase [Streptomyces sp. CA-111067]|uniref:GNAT family N-acetyltransferase n=1 Tax=Streptomyces sp. CA-111067 TaxID=3240046 RepID=UPI003D958CDC
MTDPAGGERARSAVTVSDDPQKKRYEARIGGEVAGVAAYIRTHDMIAFIHTEVRDEYEGRGVGSSLARSALDEARAQGLRVLAVCPFFDGWMGKHPEYDDLRYVPASQVTD